MDEIKELTPEEYAALSKVDKQRYTFKRNKALRDAARAKLFEQQMKDREDNLTALRSIRDNKHTKPAMKQFAVLAIDAMMGSRDIPSYLIDPMIRAEERNRDKVIQAFKRELAEQSK